MYVITYIYQLYHHIITRIMAISRYHQFFRLISPYHLIFRRISCITRKSDITISPKFFGEYHHITPKKVQYHRITIPWGGAVMFTYFAISAVMTLTLHICLTLLLGETKPSPTTLAHDTNISRVTA